MGEAGHALMTKIGIHAGFGLLLALLATPGFTQERTLITAFRAAPAEFAGLGAECADVLATSLPRTQVAIPKSAVAQELLLRQWHEPLTTAQLTLLAQESRAASFVRGAFRVTFPRARVRTARVELAMELVEAIDQSVLGGVAVEPQSLKLTGDSATHADQIARLRHGIA
jgi:hypothetical protein